MAKEAERHKKRYKDLADKISREKVRDKRALREGPAMVVEAQEETARCVRARDLRAAATALAHPRVPDARRAPDAPRVS